MSQALGDKAAIKFAVAFYDAIAAGQNVESAFKLSRAVLVSLGEQLTPELKKRTDIVPGQTHLNSVIHAQQGFQNLVTKLNNG